MLTSASENNKRIAKNTLLLYFRMGLILVVTLYTSRMILKYLGVEDFGIYNVVGGITSLMTIVNHAMTTATNRYLAYHVGKGDSEQLRKTFCITFSIYIYLCIFFFILAETVGLWFLNTYLNIPDERMVAANWIYQFTIISVINSLMVDPYNAAIVAHEHMGVYAYVSILEYTLKLAAVLCLPLIPFDRLITYAALYLIVRLIITMIYRIYCIRKFPECHFKYYHDPVMFREILSYSGWNLFGAGAGAAKGAGVNILLNIFFSPSVNAARGIAGQVNGALGMFVSNFTFAVKPQITKYYAQDNLNEMFKLVVRSTKFSWYLLWMVKLPVLIEAPILIQLWLGQLPDYVVSFVRMTIIISAVNSLSSPLMTVAHATGRIKLYQFLVGMLQILIVPACYMVLKCGGNPVSAYIVALCVDMVSLIARLWIVKRLVPSFPLSRYPIDIFLPVIAVSLVASALPVMSHLYFPTTLSYAVLNCIIAVLSTVSVVYFFGLRKDERGYILALIKSKLKRR